MQRFQQPYVHYSIENFLSPEKYNQIVQAYNHLQFIQKQSDLFHFYQTNQLVDQPSVAFFKDQLNRQFGQMQSLQNTWYNIFASYYFEGDYLLCHDDVIDDRKYAFSYYLEDHHSADLILYDSTASKVVKSIKVKKNTLVIFEVSNISYHQVALSHEDGRKAVTGWLNQKGQGTLRQAKIIAPFVANLPQNLTKFQLEEDLTKQQYFSFPGMQYLFQATEQQQAGPLYARRATKLILDQYVVLDIKKANLLSVDCYLFKKQDYLLLNDPVNCLGGNIIDVFILQLKRETKPQGSFIKVIDEEGNVTGGIPYEDNCMFVVNRGKKNYYIDLVEEEIYVCHMIYQKKGKKESKNEVRNVKKLRNKLMQHHKTVREQNQKKNGKKKVIKKQQKGQVKPKKSTKANK